MITIDIESGLDGKISFSNPITFMEEFKKIQVAYVHWALSESIDNEKVIRESLDKIISDCKKEVLGN